MHEEGRTEHRSVTNVVEIDEGERGLVAVVTHASVGLCAERARARGGVGLLELRGGGDGNRLAEEGDVDVEVVVYEVLLGHTQRSVISLHPEGGNADTHHLVAVTGDASVHGAGEGVVGLLHDDSSKSAPAPATRAVQLTP